MNEEEKLYLLALGMVPKIGNVHARNLISYCGSAKQVFTSKKSHLLKIPGIGDKLSESLMNNNLLNQAEKELKYLEKNAIKVFFISEPDYPKRLKEIHDAPFYFFYRGNTDLDAEKVISIVGTRTPTDYGKSLVEEIISELTQYSVLIVSGLAYGIDTLAHKFTIQNNLNTIAVLGGGLEKIYPFSNTELSKKITKQGGLLTEYSSQTKPDAPNFPARNRIIAGLCDAVIVIEAAFTGGALITADFANQYNREVFAIPGNLKSKFSEGCNKLIKINKAALYTSVKDLEYLLNWTNKSKTTNVQQLPLFTSFNEQEQILLKLFQEHNEMHSDELIVLSGLTHSKLASTLLNLELQNMIRIIPGSRYKIV